MKVTSVIKKVFPKDVRHTFAVLSNAAKVGNAAGKRCARINNKGLVKDAFCRGKAISRNIEFKKDDIPAISAALSSVLLLPVPGSTFIGYGIGKAIKGGISIFKKGAK